MNFSKVALISGITGQDGSYLAEFLHEKSYIVHGIKRRASSLNTQRVDHIYQDRHIENSNFRLHYGDLTDASNLIRIIQQTQPDEIYNLGAQSHVAVSFESPEYTADVDAIGTLLILGAIRILKLEKKTRFYQDSPSELYGSCAGKTAEGNNTVLHLQPLWCSYAVHLLDHGQLSGRLWHIRLQRHPVQLGEYQKGRNLRHPQEHARTGKHQPGTRRMSVHGQHRCAPRFGACQRFCAHAVAYAAAG